ncbi:hypothetical protein LX36DRAFT_182345 [Colletotrichum falcatum]|nr:hypothetical protein LX36DRAFT_182345 [Colletotrichum falcatum]
MLQKVCACVSGKTPAGPFATSHLPPVSLRKQGRPPCDWFPMPYSRLSSPSVKFYAVLGAVMDGVVDAVSSVLSRLQQCILNPGTMIKFSQLVSPSPPPTCVGEILLSLFFSPRVPLIMRHHSSKMNPRDQPSLLARRKTRQLQLLPPVPQAKLANWSDAACSDTDGDALPL